MTIPKRNRRSISVDGIDYHWTIGTKDEHRRGTATVQHASGSGAKLIIDPIGTLLPGDVECAIRLAIKSGWRPQESGSAFWIGFSDELTGDSRFVLRNASDPPYWSDPNRRSNYAR